jgi:transcriptional regulator with XRE-family HTH domain
MAKTDGLDTLGSRLRFARLRRGLTCSSLAQAAGVADSYPSLIECGTRPRVGADIIDRLAASLDVSIEWLMRGGEIPASLADVEPLEPGDEPDTADETPQAKRRSEPPKRAMGA